MNYFANIPIKFKNHFTRPVDSDDENEDDNNNNENEPAISDTEEGEDDSGIADEETPVPSNFPDVQISDDSLDTQTTALNNFFGYW